MDEGEMTPPNEGPSHVPEDSQLTMPSEGEIYMPEEGAEIHAQTIQTEETEQTETGQTSVVTTSETVDTIIHHETVEYESETLTREEGEAIFEVEVDNISDAEEEYIGSEGDGAPIEETDGSVGEEQMIDKLESMDDSAADMDVIHSLETSEDTAFEITKENEGQTEEVIDGESQKMIETPNIVEEPPPPKPVEPQFKFDVVMKSQGEGKTEFDMILQKKSGMLWGFKIKGGRDLDIPLEVKQVHEGSIAEKAGLKIEDMIVAINDENILDLCHNHACKTILDAGDNLKISVLSCDIDGEMGEAVLATIESAKSALADSKEIVNIIQNQVKRAEDANVSIQIKEAYKKVQVQVTEEYQLVDDDPNTLGIGVRQSEEGEVAVIIRGQVLDCDEVTLLSVNQKYKEEIKTEEKEASPVPIEIKPPKVMWVADVSTPEPEPEPSQPLALSMPTEETVNEEANDTGVVPPTLEGLTADYEPAEVESPEEAYELIIGKIQYVPPSERPYPKSYFYQPKQGDLRKVNWPPKSNVSTKIVKPRIVREDELHRDRSATPKKLPAKVASQPAKLPWVTTPQAAAPPASMHMAAAPAPEPEPVQSANVEGEGITASAVPVQEEKEQAPASEAPQGVVQSDNAPPTGPVEAQPAAPEGESQGVSSEEVVTPQPSENPAGSSQAEVSQNEAQMPDPTPQEVKVEPSTETAPQPPSE